MRVNTAFHGPLVLKGTACLAVYVFSLDRHLFKVFGGQAWTGKCPACVLAGAVDKLFKETLVLLLSFVFSCWCQLSNPSGRLSVFKMPREVPPGFTPSFPLVFINMNLCTIVFNEQTIYLFIKLNKSISPTSKTATALVQTVAADATT